jgi:dihydroorotate dehydrogenase (NAD+) catalytic subunit
VSRRGGRRGASTAPVDLTTTLGPLTLPNPVLTASGTSGLGVELAPWIDLAGLGAVVTKSLSVDAWPGNPPPRLVPAAAGMLNSVGLQNPGVGAWAATHLPALTASGARVVASVWAGTVDGYRRGAEAVAAACGPGSPVVAVEANISCPNVEDRRRMFAHDEGAAGAAVGAVVEGVAAVGLPVLAKLSPNVTDLPAIAAATLASGATGLTLVNTLMGMAIDPSSGRARLGHGGGGLSGPALHPVAVRAVYECRAAFSSTPIIGVGGVSTGADAAELLAAGADAVQVGSATFADPRAPARVLAELRSWCAANAVTHIDQLRGRAHV